MLNATPYLLVLLSAFSHAYWNYLLKKSGGSQLVVGLSKMAEVALCAPIALVLIATGTLGVSRGLAGLAVVGAVLTLSNYVLLALAYARGELSLVYPVSRGAVLLFLPVLGFVVFGERLTPVGVLALVLILGGILAMQLSALAWREVRLLGARVRERSATALAVAAAAAAAGYTIWDKRAVTRVPTFAYFVAYTTLVAAAYAIFILRTHERSSIRQAWAQHRWTIVQIGALNTITYLLVLVALRAAVSSYVIALRQLSIAVGAFLGWRLLGEPFGAPRRLGVALLIGGCLLVALA